MCIRDCMEIKTEASLAEAEYDEMKYFMTAIMDAGELLAAHGAEVSRVEDTITRLCMAEKGKKHRFAWNWGCI